MSRPYPTFTPLGRTMFQRGLRVLDVAQMSGVNARTLTEYLAARRHWIEDHLQAVSRALGVPADELRVDPYQQRGHYYAKTPLGARMNELGVSIAEVARKAGVWEAAVEGMIRGDTHWGQLACDDVAKVLGTSSEALGLRGVGRRIEACVLAFDVRKVSGHSERTDLGRLMNACEVSVSYVAKRANLTYEVVESGMR